MTQLLKQQNGVWQITDNQPTDWSDAEAFSAGSALKLAVDAEPDKAWASAQPDRRRFSCAHRRSRTVISRTATTARPLYG